MDTGHFNCRDYAFPEATDYSLLSGKDVHDERARSLQLEEERINPFLILRLPVELRQTIYSYLLPTVEPRNDGKILWTPGQTSLLCVSRLVHDECAALIYGNNPFVLIVEYDSITFWYLSLIHI